MTTDNIEYILLDNATREDYARQKGKDSLRELHVDDHVGMIPQSKGGYTFVAKHGNLYIRFAEIYYKCMDGQLQALDEAYFEQIKIDADYRRRGIATRLVQLCIDRAHLSNAYQIGGYSQSTKIEAIGMWIKLGFCMSYANMVGGATDGFYFLRQLRNEAQLAQQVDSEGTPLRGAPDL